MQKPLNQILNTGCLNLIVATSNKSKIIDIVQAVEKQNECLEKDINNGLRKTNGYTQIKVWLIQDKKKNALDRELDLYHLLSETTFEEYQEDIQEKAKLKLKKLENALIEKIYKQDVEDFTLTQVTKNNIETILDGSYYNSDTSHYNTIKLKDVALNQLNKASFTTLNYYEWHLLTDAQEIILKALPNVNTKKMLDDDGCLFADMQAKALITMLKNAYGKKNYNCYEKVKVNEYEETEIGSCTYITSFASKPIFIDLNGSKENTIQTCVSCRSGYLHRSNDGDILSTFADLNFNLEPTYKSEGEQKTFTQKYKEENLFVATTQDGLSCSRYVSLANQVLSGRERSIRSTLINELYGKILYYIDYIEDGIDYDEMYRSW